MGTTRGGDGEAAGIAPVETELESVAAQPEPITVPAEFAAAIHDGRLILNSPEAQRIGGKVALRSFLEGVTSPTFDAEVAVLRG